MTPSDFEASQREFLIRQKLERLVEDGVAVTEAELPCCVRGTEPQSEKGRLREEQGLF